MEMLQHTPMKKLNKATQYTLAIVGFVVFGLTGFQQARAQVMPHQSRFQSVGTVNCASSTCHGSIDERSATPVLQNEYSTWLRQDPHTQAYSVLKNEESRRIARNLGLPQAAHESKVCLDCHSHNAPQQLRGARFDIADGVNCEGCHGPAEKWIKTHVEPKPSHAKNIANGLYPTNEPAAVAKLCTSCHVGDASRPITHQVMGAGHPRISIEVDTFLALQPPHYRIDDDWAQRKGSFDGVKIWAMGQFAASANLLELMADSKRNRQGILPELMMFDCHSCHSPMSKKDWAPAMAQSPGQARINNSGLLMVQAIVRGALPAQAPALADKIKAVHLASTSPAGNMQNLEKAAQELNSQLAALRQQIAATPFTAIVMERILWELVNLAAKGQYTDFAGAEQVYMSINSVANGLATRGNSALAKTVNQRIGKLLNSLKNDENYDRKAFQTELLALQSALGSHKP